MALERDSMKYILSQIRHICDTCRGRCAGSEAERASQRHFAGELAAFSDSVMQESFTLHPRALFGWIIPTGLCNIAAIFCYWLWGFTGSVPPALAGMLLTTISGLCFVLEFVFYRKFTDFLYPVKKSLNVFARRKPLGTVKQRIIFGGHADAAYEMPYFLQNNITGVYCMLAAAILGIAYLWILHGTVLAMRLLGKTPAFQGVWMALGILALLLIPFFTGILFFVNWRRVVDGANDNLTGCLVSISILREMSKRNIRLMHTEVCCLITGGEEEGLRGSDAFAKAHKEEFQDVETIFIALETLRETKHLRVYTRGINGTQKNSGYVAALVQEAGERCGVQIGEAGNYPGATDAEAFSREGLLACGLGGVNHTPQPYYHTRHDTPDNMDEGCIRLSLDICMEAARLYDARLQMKESHEECEYLPNMA